MKTVQVERELLESLQCACTQRERECGHRISCRFPELKQALSSEAPAQVEGRELPPVPYDQHEREMDEVMTKRDNYHDKADALAYAIAEHLGVDVGEHSSANCPWDRALEELEAKAALPSQPEAVAERVAQITAHRACCGTEHDPANGKIHGLCVVCGVPWPCEYAGSPLTPPAEAVRLLENTPRTADGIPIYVGMEVWFENDDVHFFGTTEKCVKQKVEHISAACQFHELPEHQGPYKGTHTICCEDREGGNLDFWSSKEAFLNGEKS